MFAGSSTTTPFSHQSAPSIRTGGGGRGATGMPNTSATGPVPWEFDPLTANSCMWPLVRPDTTWLTAVPSPATSVQPVQLSSRQLTCHFVAPGPSGISQRSVTEPSPGSTLRFTGARGTKAGVTWNGSEASPLPMTFTARNENIYSVPLTRPVTSWEVMEAPPGRSTQSASSCFIWYLLIVLSAGSSHWSITLPSSWKT